eukprot:3612734-Pleurochrysis_carterae.AAC.1
MSWMSRLPLPNPRPGWILQDHPFPSCVGRCLCCSRSRFRHCHPICKCACVSVGIRSSRATGSASAKYACFSVKIGYLQVAARQGSSKLVAPSQIRNGCNNGIRRRKQHEVRGRHQLPFRPYWGYRPTCLDSPNAKNTSPTVLSHTFAI